MNPHTLSLLALSLVRGLGPVTAKNLIAYCGSPESVFHTSTAKLLQIPGIGAKTAALLRNSNTLAQAEAELAFCEKHQVRVLPYLDADYPYRLKYIHDAPLVLFQTGAVNLNAQENIAIVGTRKATDYGKELADTFASFFAQKGINVVSGLAYGVDIAAHRAAVRVEGITTGVLAHGLDRIYPNAHRHKAMEMCRKGGLISEYISGIKPDAMNFPARNRIIAGLCRGVVVVEAAKTGGALITANMAFRQNREVYAIPGSIGLPYSVGCNALIRDNIAKLVMSPEEVLEDLESQWNPEGARGKQLELALKAPAIPVTAEESKVLNVLSKGDATIDQIGLHIRMPMSKLSPLLLGMEFKGLIKQRPGKKFRRL